MVPSLRLKILGGARHHLAPPTGGAHATLPLPLLLLSEDHAVVLGILFGVKLKSGIVGFCNKNWRGIIE